MEKCGECLDRVFRPRDAVLSGWVDRGSALVREIEGCYEQEIIPNWPASNVQVRQSIRSGCRQRRSWTDRYEGRVLYLVEFRPEVESPYVSHIQLPADQLKEPEGTGFRRVMSQPITDEPSDATEPRSSRAVRLRCRSSHPSILSELTCPPSLT